MPMPQVGDSAPDFEVKTEAGETIKLSDFRGKRVVLYFYPKADTPGCTTQACTFRDNYQQFRTRDVVVLGASPDTESDQLAFKEKYDLPFTLLADADHTVSDLYGIWGDHSVEFNGKAFEYTGVRRSTFIIDENGTITYSKFGVDPANNTAEILDVLESPA